MIRARKRFLLVAGLLLSGLLPPGHPPAHAGADGARISFLVTAVEEISGKRATIGRTRVEGPPGTDFTVSLAAGPFEMEARFRTDLAGEDRLTVRSLLKTRRSLGLSERGLPLYEEDVQRSRMELGFDEALALLPFGGRGSDENLRIEIVPALHPDADRGEAAPLQIRILDPAPGGSMQVRAERIPHFFRAEARLLSDGEPVASGATRLYLEERGRLRLEALPGARPLRGDLLELGLEVGLPGRTCPGGPVTLSFDMDAVGPGGRRTRVGREWAGAGPVGSPLTYELDDGLLGLEAPSLEITIGAGEPGERDRR